MKSTLLVRPNLKLFLVGALLLAVAHDLVFNGRSQSSNFSKVIPATSYPVSDQDLSKLLNLAENAPTPELYMRISSSFEQRGEMRKAIHYLRMAEQSSEVED